MTKAPSKSGERRLSREEARLWREVTGDVGRLVETDAQASAPLEESAAPPTRPRPAARGNRVPPPTPLPELRHDAQPGLDKRTAERLKRGQLRLDGRIDLHGMTQNEAHPALSDFLAASRDSGRRCVLVITGKGLRPRRLGRRVARLRAALAQRGEQSPPRACLPPGRAPGRRRRSALCPFEAGRGHRGTGATRDPGLAPR